MNVIQSRYKRTQIFSLFWLIKSVEHPPEPLDNRMVFFVGCFISGVLLKIVWINKHE